MPRNDAFTLKNTGLGPFLYAQVGTELNGSELTILSLLARLGQDPWAEAGRWVKLPKAVTIDRLSQGISQMPLSPQALTDARVTATRLIALLPAQVTTPSQTDSVLSRLSSLPRWVPVVLVLGGLAVGVAFSSLMTGNHAPAPALSDQLPPLKPAH